MRPLLLTAMLLALATTTSAQSPAADWMTVETAHFRLHYPREYEQWAMRAAGTLEPIRLEVAREIGFLPEQKIDVIVMNPVAEANGVAWPLLDAPRMIFYTEPPGPEEQLGAYGSWIDLLSVHETAHLVHMLRPARNPFERFLETSVLPVNRITLGAPRWVLEGYATVIEGRLTGAGRPNSTIRALILRRWAENGRLPSYGQLNADRRFLGMSMAYLTGSAFLEWLERRSGPDSLRNLWRRMTATQRRSFDEAFAGVFGDRPDRLYGQFVAELTASSVAIGRGASRVEGELFQESPRASGEPEVSPDGTKIAYVLRERNQPDQLVVWSTGPAEEEEKKFGERIAKMLERDPEDVAPLRTRPLPRKPLHTLTHPAGGEIVAPRWASDGKTIYFGHRMPDAQGFLHHDLHRWDFQRVTRVTHLADIRDVDLFPDGRRAIGVQSRFGATQLAEIDLARGTVTPLGEASVNRVIAQPSVSPDGSRVAHVVHEGAFWTLVVDGRPVALPGDVASPEWISNDELVVTLLAGGFAELHRVRLGTGEEASHVALTRAAGGAFDPAPAADGRMFFTSLDPDGYVLRVLPKDAATPEARTEPLGEELMPAVPPAAARRIAMTADPLQLLTARQYGIGRQEFAWFTSTNFGPEQQAMEIGARFGDVIGRLDTLVVGSLRRNDGVEGLAVATAWRGWPVELHAHAFTSEDRDGDTRDGVELRGRWSRRFVRSRLVLEGGALSGEEVFAGGSLETWQVLGASRLEGSLRADVDGSHHRAIAAIGFRSPGWSVSGEYRRDDGDRVTLGGLDSSVLPRASQLRAILDPALPLSVLDGETYDGWRVAARVPVLPFTLFYQEHRLNATQLTLAGAEFSLRTAPNPILRLPALSLRAGGARVFDAPLEGETKWWLQMVWRP